MTPNSSRLDTAYSSAVKLVIEKNSTLQDAVTKVKNGINLTTLYRRVKEAKGELSRKKLGRHPVLSTEQEQTLARVCLTFASQGIPITKEELTVLVQDTYGTSFHHRFRDGKPGRTWINNFCKRNKLSFTKPNRQAFDRFASSSAEVLTTHIVSLGQVLEDFNIDAERLFNLDETGMTATRDCHGASTNKAFTSSGTRCERRAVSFRNEIARVTLMACVSASGCSDLPLWILRDVRSLTEIFRSQTERPFANALALHFPDNRKVLLLYDGYRSHMSLKALQILQRGNVETYALPAHTSGTTQPLDVSIFSPFKHYINESLYKNMPSTIQQDELSQEISIFDLCRSFKEAYEKAFTIGNIVKGFEKTGAWPYCPARLLSRPLHKSADDLHTIVSEEGLIEMVKEKRSKLMSALDSQGTVILKRGFVDTTYGCLLTSAEVMKAISEKEKLDDKKRMLKKKREANSNLKVQREIERVRNNRIAGERKR
eukprot:IDg1809t1